MTIAPFAALEARVNRTVQQRLANAIAIYQGGTPFGVLFDRVGADPMGAGEFDAASHSCSFCIANAPGLCEGAELEIDGIAYRVAGGVQPDAGGWVSVSIYPKG